MRAPMRMATPTTTGPMGIEMRAPCTTRLKMSRLLPSVPRYVSGWSAGQPQAPRMGTS